MIIRWGLEISVEQPTNQEEADRIFQEIDISLADEHIFQDGELSFEEGMKVYKAYERLVKQIVSKTKFKIRNTKHFTMNHLLVSEQRAIGFDEICEEKINEARI